MGYIIRSKPIEDRKDSRAQVSVPFFQKCLNFLGCIVAAAIYYYLLIHSNHLWTIDTTCSVVLAEYCSWANDQKRKRMTNPDRNDESALVEKGELKNIGNNETDPRLDCLAAVVGYREDPLIFKKALGSYLQAENCQFVLASIDGDAAEDQEMVRVFQNVYPEKSTVIRLAVPFVEIALQMDRVKPNWMQDEEIIQKCCTIAKRLLDENNIRLSGEKAINRLCVSQPHMHKKGVMFTSFIFALVISDTLGLEYLWTSDSDSIVFPKTLSRTMAALAGDPKAAGASTGLSIHNKDETIITQLGNSVFLNELHLSRCFASAFGANDCQSGPCAVFRASALNAELLAWYKQTVLGHWMVVNEDRHLTTRLLLKGWRILFIPDVFTATETPVNLRRWLLQQVRWARSVHIESYSQPGIYLVQPPIFFFAALRRQVIAFAALIISIVYLFTGVVTLRFSLYDYACRTIFTLIYLALRNPLRPTMSEWLWSIPANLFYNVPLPAVQFWSLITVMNDSWGTTMRSSKELSKHSKLRLKMWEVGFFVVWTGLMGGVLGRFGATTLGASPLELMLWMGFGMSSMWIVFGYWMVVAE